MHELRRPALIWAASALVLLILQFAASPTDVRVDGIDGRLFDGWNQFDGPEYVQIATEGYEQRQLVWFPAYPLLVRGVDAVLGDAVVSAVAVSLVGGLAAVVLLWCWLRTTTLSPTARLAALGVTMLYPYGWFLYGVVYADALFMALCLGAFVLAERGLWAPSALVAALATATRPSGLALVAGLLVLSLERAGVVGPGERGPAWWQQLGAPSRLSLSSLRPRVLWPLAGAGGLAAYMAYQASRFGSPTRWISEQANYHEPGSESLLKLQYFDAWYGGFDARHLATTTFQALLLALALVSVPAVGRRFGWGYATFVLGLALLPAASVSTFMGVGRYLLPAFPAFALVGEWLADRPRLRVGWFGLSGGLMVLMAFGFSRSWYLT